MRYAARRGRQEAWYVCDRARTNRGEPLCRAIAAPPVDEAVGILIAEQMTPAAVELAIEVRKGIEARHVEADRLRCRAIKLAQTEADLAQRRFMLVDPNNRHSGLSPRVADMWLYSATIVCTAWCSVVSIGKAMATSPANRGIH